MFLLFQGCIFRFHVCFQGCNIKIAWWLDFCCTSLLAQLIATNWVKQHLWKVLPNRGGSRSIFETNSTVSQNWTTVMEDDGWGLVDDEWWWMMMVTGNDVEIMQLPPHHHHHLVVAVLGILHHGLWTRLTLHTLETLGILTSDTVSQKGLERSNLF